MEADEVLRSATESMASDAGSRRGSNSPRSLPTKSLRMRWREWAPRSGGLAKSERASTTGCVRTRAIARSNATPRPPSLRWTSLCATCPTSTTQPWPRAGFPVRAAEWCAAADSFAVTYGCPFLHARCRAHYGRILVGTGKWEIAETELLRALSMAADLGREPRIEALGGLAELRLRQGAIDEAVEILTSAGDAREIASVYSEVMIAAGHPDRAIAVLRSRLAATDTRDAVFPILAAGLVDAYLASGDLASANDAAESLPGAGHEHPQVFALTERASGLLAAARGESGVAANLLRNAAVEFDRLDLPFHAARVRVELARVVSAENPSLAVVEASWALDRLERLGAHRDAAAAAALLRNLGIATRPGPRQVGQLSQRERDVLALIKRGLTNPEIAAELFISPRTAAHHVSSILAKLNLRSRAEAAAFAATYQAEPGGDHVAIGR